MSAATEQGIRLAFPTSDEIKALKAKHRKVWEIDFSSCDAGKVLIRKPTTDEIDHYYDTLEGSKSQAVRTLAEAVVVWPDAARFQVLCADAAAIHIEIAQRARELAGVGKGSTPKEL